MWRIPWPDGNTPDTVNLARAAAIIAERGPDKLLQAIERAIAHHNAKYHLKNSLDVVRSHIAALTPRERQVFELVIRGNTNKHIARSIGGTERTIKAHRHGVMKKMQVQTLAELVSLAERVGVLENSSGGRKTA
jgi:FixJ family two-component response regulator